MNGIFLIVTIVLSFGVGYLLAMVQNGVKWRDSRLDTLIDRIRMGEKLTDSEAIEANTLAKTETTTTEGPIVIRVPTAEQLAERNKPQRLKDGDKAMTETLDDLLGQ